MPKFIISVIHKNYNKNSIKLKYFYQSGDFDFFTFEKSGNGYCKNIGDNHFSSTQIILKILSNSTSSPLKAKDSALSGSLNVLLFLIQLSSK